MGRQREREPGGERDTHRKRERHRQTEVQRDRLRDKRRQLVLYTQSTAKAISGLRRLRDTCSLSERQRKKTRTETQTQTQTERETEGNRHTQITLIHRL